MDLLKKLKKMLNYLLLGPLADWLVITASNTLQKKNSRYLKSSTTHGFLSSLSSSLRGVGLPLLLTTLGFLILNTLTYLSLISPPFGFLTFCTANLWVYVGTSLAALLAGSLAYLLLGSLFALSYTLFHKIPFVGTVWRNETPYNKENDNRTKNINRFHLWRDIITLSTIVGVITAGLLVTGFILTNLGFAPEIAGLDLVSTLSTLFGTHIIAKITAITVSALSCIACSLIAGFVVGGILEVLGAALTFKESSRKDASKLPILLLPYEIVRNAFLGSDDPHMYDHSTAAWRGFLLGGLVGTSLLLTAIFVTHTALMPSLAFWGPALVSISLVLGSAVMGSIASVLIAHSLSNPPANTVTLAPTNASMSPIILSTQKAASPAECPHQPSNSFAPPITATPAISKQLAIQVLLHTDNCNTAPVLDYTVSYIPIAL